MNFKKPLLFFLSFMLGGCSPPFTCDYDPNQYELKGAFSVKSLEDMTLPPVDFVSKLESYGSNKNYCVANTSRKQIDMNRFLVNIQIIKEDFAFHIFGFNGFTVHFELKNDHEGIKTEIKSFCDLIESYIKVDKVKYYEDTGKLCDFK